MAKASSSGGKIGRNKDKCAKYRARVGKPAGPGKSGQHQHRSNKKQKS